MILRISIIALGCVLVCGGSHAAERTEQIGNWKYLSIEDKMTDQDRYVAAADGNNGAVVIKCDVAKPDSVYVGFYANKYLGAGSSPARLLKYRVDKATPVEVRWSYDKTYANQFNRAAAANFIDSIRHGKRLIVEAYTYEFETVESDIDLTGIDKVADRIRHDCKS